MGEVLTENTDDPTKQAAFYRIALAILALRGGGTFKVTDVIKDLEATKSYTLICRFTPGGGGEMEVRLIDKNVVGRG